MERREEWERKTTEELLELYKETKDLAVKQVYRIDQEHRIADAERVYRIFPSGGYDQ